MNLVYIYFYNTFILFTITIKSIKYFYRSTKVQILHFPPLNFKQNKYKSVQIIHIVSYMTNATCPKYLKFLKRANTFCITFKLWHLINFSCSIKREQISLKYSIEYC